MSSPATESRLATENDDIESHIETKPRSRSFVDYLSRSRASSNSSSGTRGRAPTYTPVAHDQAPTVLTFSNITVKTKTSTPKILLNNISGNITGGMWAIMGASGGGKTTLLSTLSLRLDPNFMEIEGEFRLNGREYSRQVLKAMSAYVMQDDLMHAELTVRETLSFSSELRMDAKLTHEQRLQRVDEVVGLMELTHCEDVLIGDSRKKGISGGERKRVSIGIELLNKPKLVFLDEPTSSLDSTTAFTVTKILKKLTDMNECTVVCTIHQPQPKIFFTFDNLILMKKGEIVYQGQLLKVVKFLEYVGHPCPHDTNLSDHLLDVISPSREDTADVDQSKVFVPVDLNLGIDKPFLTSNGSADWIREFFVLFRRNMVIYLRSGDVILFNFLASIIISIFLSLSFWCNIGNSQRATTSVLPSLFFAIVNQGVVGSLQAVTSFPRERAIMLRERASGSYGVSSYSVAKFACDVITLTWQPIIVSLFVYFNIGYQHRADKFFIYMFFLILDALAATSLATTVVCTCVSIERSTVVLSFLFEISRLYGGYYTTPKMLHEHEDWKFADALSYIKYAYVGLALNELEGLEFQCPSGTCAITTGEQIIQQKGFDEYTVQSCFGYLILLIVGFRFLAYLGLRFIKG